MEWSVARAAAARLAPHGAHRASQRGWTPLHLAADNGRAEVVGQLVKLGADVNRKVVSCFILL
jgi:ankyrin repeat protein